MLWVALASFLTAACGGAFLMVRVIQKKPLPSIVTILHGVFGALGLTLLIIAALSAGSFGAVGVALVVLVLVALGGLLNLLIHLKKGKPWLPLVLIHGAAAIFGASVLIYAILSQG